MGPLIVPTLNFNTVQFENVAQNKNEIENWKICSGCEALLGFTHSHSFIQFRILFKEMFVSVSVLHASNFRHSKFYMKISLVKSKLIRKFDLKTFSEKVRFPSLGNDEPDKIMRSICQGAW